MSDPRLVRTLAHALRHDPWKYGLELDGDGWASLDDVVLGLRFDRYDWALLERADVEAIVGESGDRFELRDRRIRATYGHSIPLGALAPIEPPAEMLFHGTTESAAASILRDGLLPMARRFVHLTADPEYAARVAEAKGGRTILSILAAMAAAGGVVFRRANAHVWLADAVPAAFVVELPFPTACEPGFAAD